MTLGLQAARLRRTHCKHVVRLFCPTAVPSSPGSELMSGELVQGPNDPMRGQLGLPGVFAGWAQKAKLRGGFVSCGPLAVRVHIDRLCRAMLDNADFTEVRPTGDHGKVFKLNPWQHMRPYRIRFKPGTQPLP